MMVKVKVKRTTIRMVENCLCNIPTVDEHRMLMIIVFWALSIESAL